MDTWRTLCVYLVRTADNSSSYPVAPQMLNDLTYPKARSIFFLSLGPTLLALWAYLHLPHGLQVERVADGAFTCGWQCILYLLGEGGLRRLWSSPATFKHEAVPAFHVMWTWMRHGVSRGRTRTIYHSKFIKWPSHSEEKDQRKDNINGVFKRLI